MVAIYPPAAAGGGSNPTHQQAALGADVAMTTNATFYDGPSLSLVAGNYVVWAQINASHSTAGTAFTARIWDGTTTYAEVEFVLPTANLTVGAMLVAYISLAGTTTIKVSVTASANTATLKANPTQNSSAANKATQIVAMLVA